MSDIEEALASQMRALKLSPPEREYRFHPKRRWRLDFAWPSIKLAVEIEGGVWSGGRHVRGKGFENDCEKQANAVFLGWKYYRFTSKQVKDGIALYFIEKELDRAYFGSQENKRETA